MKIKFYFITFLLAAIVMVILFKKPILIKAQTEPVKQEQVWQCLTSNHKSVHDYTAEAEGNCFPTDRDIYLVTCVGINTRRNQECTTGNAEYDQLLGLNGHADYIQILSQNPPGKTRTSDGNVKLSVKDVGYFHTGTLAFFGVTFGLPSQGLGTGGVEGEENTQQQGTVVFPSLTPIEEIEKCTVIG